MTNTTKLLWPTLTFLTDSKNFLSPTPPPHTFFFFWHSTLKALQACDEKIQMPSLKPSEGKKHSQRKGFSILRPYPLLFYPRSMCNCVCMRVYGWMSTCKARPLQKTPLHVSSTGKCWGPHQRAVLTLPALKLSSDKKPGSSKGGSSQGLTAGDSSPDESWGHPPGSGGLVTDRQARGRTRSRGSVRWPFKCPWHELFPWQALPLLCRMNNTHGVWSYMICCLLFQLIWTLWQRNWRPPRLVFSYKSW